jgi:hypothetical protein
VLFLSPIILGVLWLGGASWSNSHPKIGENVPHVDWLPASVSNVSYYRTYSFTAYEFDISETGFVAMATNRGWNLSEITNQHSVMTYRMAPQMRERYPIPTSDLSTDAEVEKYKRDMRILRPEVTNGFWHEIRQSNGGGINVVFDRIRQRAYVQSSPR